MKRGVIICVLAVALSLGMAPPESAHAYSLGYGRFSPPTGYWATGTLFPSAWVTPAINASNAWTNVMACDFVWSRNQVLGQLNGNYVTNYNNGADGKPGNTVYSYNGTTIIQLRINLNTYYPFATDGRSTAYDVQNTLTHEFGHGLPLNHSTYTAATMFAYTSKGETLKRSLYSDDIYGIQALY
ncbi:MAG: matrixin family metalloprotease [Actinobacteria bacterium]|nr:matrixin family metalloprotease [Actinomycetota bacterium]